jgi:mannose-6-phosphate isomerase-like protein (cupin superfamily)
MKAKVSVVWFLLVLLGLCFPTWAQVGSLQYTRPTFDRPTHIPFESSRLAFWGESDVSGYASDWIYVSNDKIHQLLFQMPPGAFYRSTERSPVVYGADEVWCVLSGTLLLNNPETGEAHLVNKGQAAFFRKDTWHHGFSYGKEPVRVLEFFAPPPATGTTGAYSKSKPFLKKFKESQDEWIGKWPMSRPEAQRRYTMEVMGDSDLLWRLEGQALVGLYASTEHLTAGKMTLLPGQKSDLHTHQGDESIYLLEGSLNVNTPKSEGQQSFILKPADGFYVPKGTPHQFFNMSDQPLTLLFGVAPKYLPDNQ